MSKVLALDYGDKRIGVATSDDSSLLAFGFGIIDNRGNEYIIDTLKKIVDENDVGLIVVGIPVSLGGKDNPQLGIVNDFIGMLRGNINIDIEEVDERYSSKMGEANIREAKSKKKFDKGEIDIEAAKIILQDYLDKNK